MNKNQIARKYSRALVSRVEISQIPDIVNELKAFSKLIDQNKQLKLLFAGRIFSEAEKEKAWNALLPHMKLSGATEQFLKLTILQGHLSAINNIISASIDIYNERQNKATAVVTSAVKLDLKYTERLKKALKNMTGTDIDIETKIDSALLGGFIVRVGSTIYDSSIQGQLRLLKAELTR